MTPQGMRGDGGLGKGRKREGKYLSHIYIFHLGTLLVHEREGKYLSHIYVFHLVTRERKGGGVCPRSLTPVAPLGMRREGDWKGEEEGRGVFELEPLGWCRLSHGTVMADLDMVRVFELYLPSAWAFS